MSRTAWIRIAVLCPILWIVANDIISCGRPSFFTMGVSLSAVAFWMCKRNQEQAIQALLFLGVWAGIIGLGLIAEWSFNSTPMHGGGGMPVMPVAILSALYLGWIPAAVVTIALAIPRARDNTRTSQPDHRSRSS